jgi:hypothetical protein
MFHSVAAARVARVKLFGTVVVRAAAAALA